MIIAAIVIFLLTAAFVWHVLGPWDEGLYPRDDGQDYFPFWSERK